MASTYSDLAQYPLIAPPVHLAVKPARTWTLAEAQEYLAFLVSALPVRITYMLQYLDVSRASPTDALLDRVGNAFEQVIVGERFSYKKDGYFHLTSEGFSIAADAGLLVAQCAIDTVGEKLRWDICRKGKREVCYNLPVLEGLPLHVDPVAAGTGYAYRILYSKGTGAVLAQAFHLFVEEAATRPS